jgi:hypothetical protein
MEIESFISNMHIANNTYGTKNTKENKEVKESKETGVANQTTAGKMVDVKGKTIGQPKLSEKAAKYYEELATFVDVKRPLVVSGLYEIIMLLGM